MDMYSFCGYDCSLLYCDVGSFTSILGQTTTGAIAKTFTAALCQLVWRKLADDGQRPLALNFLAPVTPIVQERLL